MTCRGAPIALAAIAAIAVLLLAAPPAVAQRGRGELVRIPFVHDDGSLTPYSFARGYPFMTLVYDTLLWRDARGVPRPWLARSVTTSSDGRRLIVRLARGVRWHDGVALSAADVAFTFELMRTREHPRFTPQLRDVADVRVITRHRLVIRLRRPAPGFRDQPLADVPILPRHLWARLPAGRSEPAGPPVGSGPYRLVGHRRGSGYRFVANDRYFLGRPAVRTIEVSIVRDGRSMLRAFERGRADLIPVTPAAARSATLAELGNVVARGPSYLGTVLMFNMRRPPFRSARMRRAVAQALDLVRIAGSTGDSAQGGGAVASGHGYVHPDSRWAPTEQLHTFDPSAARSVLAAGARRPLRVLAPEDDPAGLEAGRQVVLALRRAGARAALAARSSRALADAVGQDGARPTFELAIWSSPPLASYDPDFVRVVFGAGGPLNYSGYRSAAFERLADRVATARSASARRAAVAAELRLLARDLPVVPLFFADGAFAYRRAAYDGWRFVAGAGVLDKRSFLPRPASGADRRPAPPPASSGSAAIGTLGLIALGSMALALSIVAVASVRKGR